MKRVTGGLIEGKQFVAAASVLFGVVLFMCWMAPASDAGTYRVRDCFYNSATHRYDNTGIAVVSKTSGAAGAGIEATPCSKPNYPWDDVFLDSHNLFVPKGTYPLGTKATIFYSVPEGAEITGVSGATGTFAASGGFMARLMLETDGAGVVVPHTYAGVDFGLTLSPGTRRRNFKADIKCHVTTCNPTGWSAIQMESVLLTVNDYAPPVIGAPYGTLFAGGNVSGDREVSVNTVDVQSGVDVTIMVVNGTVVKSTALSCESLSSPGGGAGDSYRSLRPCPLFSYDNWEVDTRQAPFKNGANTVLVCARDLSGEGSCTDPMTVQVQN